MGYVSSAEYFDTSVQGWRLVAPMLEARAGAASAIVASRLYVCGGFGAFGQVLASVECFDPEVGSWETITRTPALRTGVAATAAAGHLLLFGGYQGSGPLRDVHRFDPNALMASSSRGVSSSTAWAVLPAMNTRRENAVAISTFGE